MSAAAFPNAGDPGFDRRYGMFLAMLDDGMDVTGTPYPTQEEDILGDIPEGLPPELAAALTRKATADARISEAKATEATLQLKNIKASNDANRVLVMSGPILETDEISNLLMRWSRRDPGKDITIYLNTPGGSIFDGNALGATLKQLKAKGHHITIYGSGTVLSMGAILLQYADERVLDEDAVFMIHSLAGGLSGQIESMLDTTDMLKKVHDRLLGKLAERSTMTQAQLKRKTARKEWFLTAPEALKLGFCDRIE